LRTEQRKYEATGKYDPAGYAEAYGFLAAAVRHVLSDEQEGHAAERDDLAARLLTNDAGMAELVKRFDVAIYERDDARGQRDSAGDEVLRLMKERDALRELIDHVRRELFVPESWPGGPPLAELIRAHLAELIEERSQYKGGEAEAWQEVAKLTAELEAMRVLLDRARVKVPMGDRVYADIVQALRKPPGAGP
jgi:chromosome segregation ATPase